MCLTFCSADAADLKLTKMASSKYVLLRKACMSMGLRVTRAPLVGATALVEEEAVAVPSFPAVPSCACVGEAAGPEQECALDTSLATRSAVTVGTGY